MPTCFSKMPDDMPGFTETIIYEPPLEIGTVTERDEKAKGEISPLKFMEELTIHRMEDDAQLIRSVHVAMATQERLNRVVAILTDG